jgi:actin related protein 2/3 complex subunit 3
LRSKVKGPAWTTDGLDIIDEAIKYFRANIFFKNYEVKGNELK